jgi:hypothetical protein
MPVLLTDADRLVCMQACGAADGSVQVIPIRRLTSTTCSPHVFATDHISREDESSPPEHSAITAITQSRDHGVIMGSANGKLMLWSKEAGCTAAPNHQRRACITACKEHLGLLVVGDAQGHVSVTDLDAKKLLASGRYAAQNVRHVPVLNASKYRLSC